MRDFSQPNKVNSFPVSPSQWPTISLVIPCRNERLFVAHCLDSIIRNDYPKNKLEVLFIDGFSEDGTRTIIEKYCQQYPFVHLLDNVGREQQLALNIGIIAAKGEIIMRLAAHSTYKENYIFECMKALYEYGADDVGGRWITVPRDKTLVGYAICFATSIRFGVGNAYYRLASLKKRNTAVLAKPRWGIHSVGFCCRKEVFKKVGLFNEHLARSEDIDWWSRLKAAGLRTLFVPTAECYYSMRTQWSQFARHMFLNGKWVLLPLQHTPHVSFDLRHTVPLLFLSSLLFTIGLSLFWDKGYFFFAFIFATYMVATFYYSLRISIRERDARFFFVLPLVFLTLHFAYGFGSLVGFFHLAKSTLKTAFTRCGGHTRSEEHG